MCFCLSKKTSHHQKLRNIECENPRWPRKKIKGEAQKPATKVAFYIMRAETMRGKRACYVTSIFQMPVFFFFFLCFLWTHLSPWRALIYKATYVFLKKKKKKKNSWVQLTDKVGKIIQTNTK